MKPNLLPAVLIHDAFWAIYEPSGRQLQAQLERITTIDHQIEFEQRREAEAARGIDERPEKPYQMAGNVAIIQISGAMTKSVTSMSSGTSTTQVRRLIRQAAADPDVKAILLDIDSPGGSVSGTEQLANDVAEAARKKPVYGYGSDLVASAAYWVYSQCTACYANPTALIGSIGTYMVVDDSSKLYQRAGITVHVLSTGPHKGAGIEGTGITEDQLAEFQRTVDALNEHFVAAVSRGRGIQVEAGSEPADGRVYIASDAVAIGLIDGIASMDEVIAMARSQAARPRVLSEHNVTTESGAPIAMPLVSALESVLIAAEGLAEAVTAVSERVAEVKDLRASQHRTFSHERLEQVRSASSVISGLANDFAALLASCEALSAPVAAPAAANQDRSALDIAVDRVLADASADLTLAR